MLPVTSPVPRQYILRAFCILLVLLKRLVEGTFLRFGFSLRIVESIDICVGQFPREFQIANRSNGDAVVNARKRKERSFAITS